MKFKYYFTIISILGLKFVKSFEEHECGTVKTSIETLYRIHNGQESTKFQSPWKAALFKVNERAYSINWNYFCGGTLINTNIILTAAHCLHPKNGKLLNSQELLVVLGAHDLSLKHENGRKSIYADEIILHPNWNAKEPSRYNDDIAIIKMTESVIFSEFIRPICITNEMLNFGKGKVVGWGASRNFGEFENISRIVELPIIKLDRCLLENYLLAPIAWKDSFCAGIVGAGVCSGDSGSGLFIEKRGKYFLKGFVSSTITVPCSEINMTIFTEVSNYYNFIMKQVESKEEVQGRTAEINCKYFNAKYICQLNTENIISSNILIDKIEVKHLYGKTRFDVEKVEINVYNSTQLFFLKDGLLESFQSSTFPNANELNIQGFNTDLRDSIRREQLKEFKSFKRISIENCKISNLVEDLFYDLTDIRELNLTSNEIVEIPSNLFLKSILMFHLSLQNNKIEQIHAEIFRNNRNLKSINLSNNYIKDVYLNINELPLLTQIHLRDNICINRNFNSRQEIIQRSWTQSLCVKRFY